MPHLRGWLPAGVICLALELFAGPLPAPAPRPARVILAIIDGLHCDAPRRLAMTNLLELAALGATVEKTWGIMPAHPATGPWAELHTTSYPNPVMMAGTLFITPQTRYLQECFGRRPTAHVANSTAYASLNRHYKYSMVRNVPDAAAVDFAIHLLQTADIVFMRLHLQNTGTAGYHCSRAKPGAPGRQNIWAADSPYVQAALAADRELGRLVAALRKAGKWDDTLLVITADHGQADTGWHPLLAEASWCTPLIFIGPGIRAGSTLPVAAHTDIAPTICHLHGIEPPGNDRGAGRILAEILLAPPAAPRATPADRNTAPRIYEINQSLKDYMLLRAQMILRAAEADPHLENAAMLAERRFHGIEQFLDWHKTGSLADLLQANQKVLEQMRQALRASMEKH